MFKTLMIATLCAASTGAAFAQAAAPASAGKKELVAKMLELQRPGLERLGQNMAEQPAMQLMQQAGVVLQQQPAGEKRDTTAREIEADLRKYAEETVPTVRAMAVKMAPSTFGAMMEEKLDESELRQVLAVLESPAFRKYLQLEAEAQRAMTPKLIAEARPYLEPKLRALDQTVGRRLGIKAPAAASAPAPTGKK
jgi:hypothetical protein